MKSIKKVAVLVVAIAVLFSFAPSLWAQDSDKLNLNTATAEQLVQLKGIGAKYAERIVQYRTENGPFKAPEDIMKVPGIGQKIFENNQERITVE